jgi:hypothetical protein
LLDNPSKGLPVRDIDFHVRQERRDINKILGLCTVQVCAEGYQQADQNLRASFFAEMLGYPVLRYSPGKAHSKRDAATRDPQERAEGIDERECPGQSRSDGKRYYDRIVDVAEKLVKFTLLTRGASEYLTDR